MQIETGMIGLLILLLCILASAIVLFIKAKSHRLFSIVICVATVIAIVLTVLPIGNDNHIKNFKAFSIADIACTNEMIDSILQTQAVDDADSLSSADDLENRIMINTFDLNFMNNSFSNLKFGIILSERGKLFEASYQLNYVGQVFANPKTSVSPEAFDDNTVPLIELKSVIETLGESDLLQKISASASTCVNVMFNGQTNTLAETEDSDNLYIIQDGNVIPLSAAVPQGNAGYYVFSIISGTDYIQILSPKYAQ